MGSVKVEVVQVGNVIKHPNADRLDLAQPSGMAWQSAVSAGSLKVGDTCIYIPIDSILSPRLEEYLFPPESKIKLEHSRIRTIKIRGAVSQGLIVEWTPSLLEKYPKLRDRSVGDDVADILGVTKYEPPAQTVPQHMRGKIKPQYNPWFQKYTDIEKWQFYPNVLKEGEQVYISEKMHGSSQRCGWMPTHVRGFWMRLKKAFGLVSEFEFCIGSRNVQLQERKPEKGKTIYYDENIYEHVCRKYNLKNKLLPYEELFGEVVGWKVQSGYEYGCKEHEYKFFAYDMKVGEKYLDIEQFLAVCIAREIPVVPQLYIGEYSISTLQELAQGPSAVLDRLGRPVQPVREGVVIRPLKERLSVAGRTVFKYLNPDYLLLKDTSEFH